MYLAKVTREKNEKAEKALLKNLKPKIEGISGFGHFDFDGKTVTVWKMHGIGKGRQYKDLSGFKRVMKIDEEGGFLASREKAKIDEELMKKGENPERFWTGYLSSKKKAGNNEEEIDDVDEIDIHGQEIEEEVKKSRGLFTCNECGATFHKYGNLVRHLDVGNHRIRPEKINLYDHALQLFKRNLEDIQEHNSILAEVSEAMTDMGHGEDHSSKEGWALKEKRKRVTYSEKAKKFSKKMFDQGDKSGRKMDPAEVARLMKDDDKIKPFERMNAQQIRSYFTTLCKANKTDKQEEEEGMDDGEDDWEDVSEEDVENIDDFGRQLDDVIEDIIYDNFDELFTDEKECLDVDADI